MGIQNKTFKSVLVILGISFLSACGDRQMGVSGGAYISAGNHSSPVVNEPVVPVEPTDIIVFATIEAYTGDLTSLSPSSSAREAADLLCDMHRTTAMGDRQVRALISIDGTDQIKDMAINFGLPIDLPFMGDLGVLIANDFADLLNGSIASTLKDSVNRVLAGEMFWTGSSADGTLLASDSCSGFKSELGTGAVGSSDAVDATWISIGADDCSFNRKLICLAF